MLGISLTVLIQLARWLLGVAVVLALLWLVGWLIWRLAGQRLLRTIQANAIQTLHGETLGYPERLYPGASNRPALRAASEIQGRIAARIPHLEDRARAQVLGSLWPRLRVMMDALYRESRLHNSDLEADLARFHEVERAVATLGNAQAADERALLHSQADAILRDLDTL